MNRRLVFLSSLVAICLLLAGAWLMRIPLMGYVMHWKAEGLWRAYEARSPQPEIEKLWPTIESDIELFKDDDVFSRASAGTKDAAAFLNPLVVWMPEQDTKSRLPDSAVTMLQAEKDFTVLKPDWAALNIDFAWLAKLREFDVWSYDSGPPRYGREASYSPLNFPLPNYGDLLAWAKLRLLKGRDDGRLSEAVRDVRQLARLVMTNDTLVSSMSALALVKLESRLHDSLDPKAREGVAWAAPSIEASERLKRYLFAQSAFADARLSDEAFRKLSIVPLGLCARVNETLASALAFRRLIRHRQKAWLERIDALVASSSAACRDSYLRRMWKDPNAPGIFKPGGDVFAMTDSVQPGAIDAPARENTRLFKTTIEDIETSDTLSEAIAGYLLSLSDFDALHLYREPAAKPEPTPETK